LVRWAYKGLGFALLGVGIAGVILPVMPGTIFLILALACFARSSPRMEAWMLGHPRFGTALRDWVGGGRMSRRTKLIAIAAVWLAIGGSMVGVPNWWWRGVALSAILCLTAFLATRPAAEES
jgi:uncharacterized membrane protein YbaN (DUF454 family)